MNIERLVNKPTFKVVRLGKYVLLANKIDLILQQQSGKNFPVNLSGLGNTGTGASGQPWLLTLANTRTSYIFLEKEHIAPSYIAERLNFYDPQDLQAVANMVQILLREV